MSLRSHNNPFGRAAKRGLLDEVDVPLAIDEECARRIGHLARACSIRLAAVARREGLSAEDSLDVVQEAFQTLLRLPRACVLAKEPDESVKLLTAVVRNSARNMRRRHYRAKPHLLLEDLEFADPQSGVDDLIARAEQRAKLHGCIRTLAEVQRRVVTLRMLQELSGSEAASRLGLRSGHVAVLLNRAKKRLERCMLQSGLDQTVLRPRRRKIRASDK